MPPIRTAKKSDKRTARPQKQRAGGRTKSQAALGRTEDATTEKPYMEEDISPELAELLGGATYFDATNVPARDAVLEIPELLENILYFTGFKTLLLSIVRVNKHFNASVAASPRLQRAMFESFTPVVTEPADPSKHFLINDALMLDIFQFPGTMTSWYFGRCCWSSSRLQTCKGEHFLKIFAQSCDTRKGRKLATGWRKLRVLSPLDNSLTCRVQISHGAVEEFPADVTLGEIYDLVQTRIRAKRPFNPADWAA